MVGSQYAESANIATNSAELATINHPTTRSLVSALVLRWTVVAILTSYYWPPPPRRPRPGTPIVGSSVVVPRPRDGGVQPSIDGPF